VEDKEEMNTQEDSRAQLTELIVTHRTALLGFILGQIPDACAAEDVFQEVCLVISRKWDSYDPQRSFRAWAFGIAKNMVKKHWERNQRDRTVLMEDEVLDQIAANPVWEEDDTAEKAALRDCLSRLSEKVRNILCMSSLDDEKPRVIGERVGWSARSVSVSLVRAKKAMMDCIERKTASEARR